MKMVVGTTFCVRKMCKLNTQNKAKPESINPKLFSLLGGGGLTKIVEVGHLLFIEYVETNLRN